MRRARLSNDDYTKAGTFSELLFLSLILANNVMRPSSTLLVFSGALFGIVGLVMMGHGYGGNHTW